MATEQRRCYVMMNSWAGRTRHDGTIVSETPKFYRVRMDKTAFNRFVAGKVTRIKKEHVRFDREGATNA